MIQDNPHHNSAQSEINFPLNEDNDPVQDALDPLNLLVGLGKPTIDTPIFQNAISTMQSLKDKG